jgi:hypothetical protein
MSVYSETVPIPPKAPPNYSDLVEWWERWPQARSEILDFWARGGYVGRLLSRREQKDYSITVAVKYIDEIEHALKRLILRY